MGMSLLWKGFLPISLHCSVEVIALVPPTFVSQGSVRLFLLDFFHALHCTPWALPHDHDRQDAYGVPSVYCKPRTSNPSFSVVTMNHTPRFVAPNQQHKRSVIPSRTIIDFLFPHRPRASPDTARIPPRPVYVTSQPLSRLQRYRHSKRRVKSFDVFQTLVLVRNTRLWDAESTFVS
ncbi:hypothetical protein AB1N83_002718 [Pleurotus pulmonarius]